MGFNAVWTKSAAGALSAILLTYFLLLFSLLRDRGKTLSIRDPSLDVAAYVSGGGIDGLTFVNDKEWRFAGASAFSRNKRSLSLPTAHPLEELNCGDLQNLTRSARFVGSGWTKATYKAALGSKEVAIKVINLNGRHMTDCLKTHGPQSLQNCYTEAARKILKEIALLKELQHANVVPILGYCIPADPYSVPVESPSSPVRMAVITELGDSMDLIRILQMDWEERLKLLYSLSHLLDFLSDSVFGSVGIGDFRRQQFVLGESRTNNQLQIVDVDDFLLEEHSCQADSDCKIQLSSKSDGNVISVPCTNGLCQGLNEKRNLQFAYSLFVKDLLPHGAPDFLKPKIEQLLEGLRAQNLTAKQFRSSIEDLAASYGSKMAFPFMVRLPSAANKFEHYANSDLAGIGDYSCMGSRSHIGCSLGVTSLTEAQSICVAHETCRAFVWTNDKTWTGRTVVHFKNNVTSPSFQHGRLLFVRKV